MTGEISLGGRLLPVGGIREKLLAALRAGHDRVIVPVQNRDDVEAIPLQVRQKLLVEYCSWVEEALGRVLAGLPWDGPVAPENAAGRVETGVRGPGAPPPTA